VVAAYLAGALGASAWADEVDPLAETLKLALMKAVLLLPLLMPTLLPGAFIYWALVDRVPGDVLTLMLGVYFGAVAFGIGRFISTR